MKATEFARRRRELMRMMGRGSIAVLPAATPRIRNRDVQYPYRQDSDFYYLTGFPEPEAVAVLVPGRAGGEYLLFCRDRDSRQESWTGRRAGPDDAVTVYGADLGMPFDEVDHVLPGLLEQCDRVFYTMGLHREFDQRLIGWVNTLRARDGAGRHTPDQFVALEHLLHDLRLYKSRQELTAMRRAARIAVQGHLRALRICRPGLYEYEIEAEFLHEFRRNGARPSYLPIVGSGPNACILHYHDNNRQLADGDLLLVDAGCEYEHYASDITRTWPVNGRFTPEQRAIYDIVLDAHEAALAAVEPGRPWNDPHEVAVERIVRGLCGLGLLKGNVRALIRSRAYQAFFMHRTGHWLGMDVHDVGDYKVGDQWRVLEPGMTLTIEPGIYIPADMRRVPARYRGIAVRIEDDVAVTRDGHEVLSIGLPRDPGEIEALVGQAGDAA